MAELSAGMLVAGRYRIERLIGSGGMANVYQAEDLTTGKSVAVKVLKAEYARDGEFVRRFRSEAQAVLNLSHENIVRSIDVGQWQDVNFIVLEYVPGKTLKETIREEAPFDNRRIISIGAQLCEGLEHAHSRNVVHRDVKPQNIILTDRGRAKIADFGIARFTDASTLTYAGDKVLGSVHYVSPEQARGERVDQKSDIYSLGIVLYEMATGTVPFDSENTVTIAVKHLQEQMVPPIERNPALSPALNGIILRATSKNKADRYDSMKELRRDLLRAVREPDVDFAGREVRRRAKSRGQASGRKGRSPQKNITLLAVLVLLIVGVIAAMVLIGSSILSRKEEAMIRYVPTLTGRTLESAMESGTGMGFKVVVRSRTVSDEIPENVVYEQEPKPGNRGREGDTIYVDVSAGPATVEAPLLTGRTLEEAQRIAKEWNLSIGSILYEPTDPAEAGTVIRQEPEAGTEMYLDDVLHLWVAGEESDQTIVPSVAAAPVEEAVQKLREAGFERILVRETESEALPGRVVSQLPAGGDLKPQQTTVELWISARQARAYSADVAYNVDVAAADSRVMVLVYDGSSYDVVYEEALPAGQHTIPLTIEADSEGPLDVIITIEGEEVRREAVTFFRKTQEDSN